MQVPHPYNGEVMSWIDLTVDRKHYGPNETTRIWVSPTDHQNIIKFLMTSRGWADIDFHAEGYIVVYPEIKSASIIHFECELKHECAPVQNFRGGMKKFMKHHLLPHYLPLNKFMQRLFPGYRVTLGYTKKLKRILLCKMVDKLNEYFPRDICWLIAEKNIIH